MKNYLRVILAAFVLTALMSSCFSHKFTIGDGPQTGVQVKEKNHFFVYGLIPGGVSDPQFMAGGAEDFEVTEVQTFVDGLLSILTLGIYTASTTKVQK